MKEAGTINWTSPNAGATNSTGFTGLPGGYRNYFGADIFYNMYDAGVWWSSSEYRPNIYWIRYLYYDNGFDLLSSYADKTTGLSVRLIKD